MLAPDLAKQNPQAIGALGGFRLELRPLRRIGDVGGIGVCHGAIQILAGLRCKPLLPLGPVPLHLGMRHSEQTHLPARCRRR